MKCGLNVVKENIIVKLASTLSHCLSNVINVDLTEEKINIKLDFSKVTSEWKFFAFIHMTRFSL